MKKFFSKFIGDRQFYAGVIFVAAPIIIQNVISNFVNLLDNLMVGQIGTEAMSGVAIVNQLIFVFNLGLFGYQSGASILGTQFYGKKDIEGVNQTFRFKLLFGVAFLAVGLAVLILKGDDLIWLYIHEGEAGVDIYQVAENASEYLKVIICGLPFFLVSQAYASSLREMQETKVPMVASLVAVGVNLCFNWMLIFGHLGMPELGARGAAIATVISRVVELLIIVIWAHTHTNIALFAKDAYKSLKIEKKTYKLLMKFTIPAFVNELLWSGGQTMLSQSFSLRGVEIISATNISGTVNLLGKCVFLAIGVCIGIMVGNALGANDPELAVETDNRMIALSFVSAITVGIIVFILSGIIPDLYNTSDVVKNYATKFIRISACIMPMDALVNGEYHTLRSGSKPIVTFLFDAGFTWAIMVPTAFILSHYTDISIIPLYTIAYCTQVIKLIVGTILVAKKIWVHNLVSDK